MSLNLHVKSEPKKINNDKIWINLEYCHNFFKMKKLGKNIRMTKSDSGSQTFGAIKGAIVFLSWSPPFGTKFLTLSKPISTMQEPKAFQEEFNKGHDEIEKYANECYEKIKANPEKWKPVLAKQKAKGFGRFKHDRIELDAVKDTDPSGYSQID
jgi:Predicted iron-dependent peroxidase